MRHCMKRQRIRQITNKIILFIGAIGLLTYKVIRQVTLPNRKRKGNLLSSLLLLFIYLNDLINSFSWGFSINFILRWKHYDRAVFMVRRIMLFTGCTLFLLSSVEWSYPDTLQITGTSHVEQAGLNLNIQDKKQEKALLFETALLKTIATKRAQADIISNISIACYHAGFIPSRIFLRNCNFRI